MTSTGRFPDILEFFKNKPPSAAGDSGYTAAFLKVLVAAASAEAASVWRLDTAGNLHLVHGTNVDPGEAEGFFLSQGEGISGAAALSRKTVVVSETDASPQHSGRLDTIIGYRTRSMMSAPIECSGRLYGVVNILNCRSGPSFPQIWEERLTVAGTLLAQALALAGTTFPENPSEPAGNTTVVVGVSPGIQNVLDLAFRAGRSEVPVLISGETGTGKELTARRIHEALPVQGRPFLAVNCAALTESILESELFGHVKGAFSGAVTSRKGKFLAAAGGTLFLDEIGDMSLSCQSKILRTIQERTVVPVGSDREIPCSARIIAATNRNIRDLVRQGRFREDLFYRLCGLEIRIPGLRERPEDIEHLAAYFLRKESPPGALRFSLEALEILRKFPWPGNVRQLEQAVRAAAALCEGGIIGPEHLPAWIGGKGFHDPDPGDDPSMPADGNFSESGRIVSDSVQEKARYLAVLNRTRYPGTGRWNVAAAARELEIPRKTLAYRIKRFGIADTRNLR